MGRAARVLLAIGVILLLTAGPALAQQDRQPVIDLNDFITAEAVQQWADRNGDYIPDIPVEGPEGDIPVGIAGIWDDAIGALTPEEFLGRVDPEGQGFDLEESGAYLFGPCGGSALSYDAKGNSLDAAVDLGDGNPPVDIYGEPAFTEGNPFQVDSGGTVLYFGFTLPDPGLSGVGDAFHDHRWELVIMGVSADDGGDPNPNDKNRNAGIMELGDLLPFQFQAKVKAQGVFVDGWGDNELSAYTADDVATVFAGHTICFGEAWVEFVGDSYPLFTAPGALATALALAGFSGILFNARPALSWRA
ncbi:MAG: hypothetical protein H6R33_102 [Actinobacteria bacterium]|nr:hypothetical protein [Actinomycetota bacterium]